MARINSCDKRTVFGQNIDKISSLCNDEIENLTKTAVKQQIKYCVTKEEDIWQEQLSMELMQCQNLALEVPGFDEKEVKELLRHSCIL